MARRDYFATTHWTAVLSAGNKNSPESKIALEELCRTYWYPLYAYIRHRNHSKEQAEDLTQSFFARFLEKNYLDGVSREKGKFRAFLLATLKHFLADEWDRSNRQKRGGGIAPLSLDWQSADTLYQIDPADNLDPDKRYDRAWAMTLLEQVVRRLREENAAAGKSKLFEQLKPFLTVDENAVSYSESATRLNLTEGAVRVTVHRLRRRYRELLHEEIGQTVSDPRQVEDELKALFRAFAP